jgi:hypothetical protein
MRDRSYIRPRCARRHFARATPVVLALALWAPVAAASPPGYRVSAASKHAHAHASVVGGSVAPAGSWPFAAFIADVSTGTACSGTVVSPMLVLTAAHCVENISAGTVSAPANLRVVTGSLDWTNRGSGQVLGVSQIDVDPTFDATTLDNDAALLVLATPTQAPSIQLASPADSSLTQAGTPAQMAGWGDSYVGESTPPTVLYQGSTVVQSAVYCAQQETLDGVLYDPAENLCAADTPSFAVSACHGDSGGPLVATTAGGEPLEIGITSHGDANCNPDYPSVFTRADAISGWVSSEIAQTPTPPGTSTTPPAVSSPAGSSSSSPIPSSPRSPSADRANSSEPQSGAFSGETAQQGGRLQLTIDGARIKALAATFTLQCRGPAKRQVHARERRALTVKLKGAAQSFLASFKDRRGWRYQIHGAFRSPTRASGTLTVTTRNGACRARGVRWTATAS